MSSPAHNRNLNGYGTHKSLDTNGGTNTGVITQTGRIPMHNTIKKMQARGGAGFTLIELLVVIAILAILSGVVVFAVGNSTKNAAKAACNAEKGSIITAWNAAYTSNQVNDSANQETWQSYMKDGTNLQFFNDPTTTGATRTAKAATDCTDIPAGALQS